jgi:hypothetical protein
MREMTDQPLLVVGTTLHQKHGEHFREIRDFSHHSKERGGGYANKAGVGQGGCGRGARRTEQAADTEKIARAGQRQNGLRPLRTTVDTLMEPLSTKNAASGGSPCE